MKKIQIILISFFLLAVVIGCSSTNNTLSAQEALDELEKSIKYDNGEISFTIPENYPTSADWSIWISGSITAEEDFSMSWHYAEGDEASNNKTWESGKRYVVSDDTITFDSLNMSVYLPDENDDILELEIDLLMYLSSQAKNELA